MSIIDLFGNKIIICDGAMGTMIQKQGLQVGELPEIFNFTHPDIIEGIHEAYFASGCDFVSANTFGANRLKLAGSGYTVEQVIGQAVSLAKKAAANVLENPMNRDKIENVGRKYVALDVAPIGKLMEPVGDLSFHEAYELFEEQIMAGVKAGADLILFETFTDIYEMKAAVLAAKENCDLPVFCSVTFQEDGRMLMGTDPITMVNILQDLGIQALGINCSLGPKQMKALMDEILNHSTIPVLVQPNAGLPVVIDGQTVYDVGVDEYVDAMMDMLRSGVAIAGGCCGTSPEYIRELNKRISLIDDKMQLPALHPNVNRHRRDRAATAVSSSTRTVVLDDRIRIIGERINPTGKKNLKEALKIGDLDFIENEAIAQVKAGAEILDINLGLPGINELDMMLKIMKKVSAVVNAPLQIDSASPEVIEAAARYYNGKPIINSVNGKQENMDAIFPIVKKYGTCVIALTLDEKGLPADAGERIAIAEKIIKEAEKYGIGRERIIVDCLTLTVSAQQNAGRDTLEAIRQVKKRFGVKTTLGASNVSFGLPERKLLNRTFLAMALEAGLDAPITDPLVPEYMDTVRAYETLSCKDRGSKDYISYYGGQEVNLEPSKVKATQTLEEVILEGYEDRSAKATEELLKTMKPLEIVEGIIIPALEKVGKEYEEGLSFLPQLIKSADTVKNAFAILKEAMKSTGDNISYGRIILATVQGDIHDIGKNIVKVLLENYGYDVIDLGKDVPIEKVVETAKNQDVKLVGLSALMTTTVANMQKTIEALKAAGLECKTAVGGAVLTADYAQKIGADHYCKDAMDTVKVANSIYKHGKC